jgi:predicted P-loop ATPase
VKFDELKFLHARGFALHWLHPRSKRPIEMRWTSGARKSFDELRAEYRKGLNVGVRLGSASKLKDGYLAVIDCDVKSTDPRHVAEMEEKLKSVFTDRERAPVVLSGRGNGSRHIYVRTEKPVKPRRLAQSREKVKVLMPSAKPSRAELEELTEAELDSGTRLRYAWEISLMGDGQQVVLPPSVHPDSGKCYAWEDEYAHANRLPLLEVHQETERERATEIVPGAFKPVAVDLALSSLPDSTYDQIVEGADVSDRSAALLSVANVMLKHGFSDAEILTTLTDPDHFLGTVAYEHAQTKDRARAAEWVRRYTLEKSKRETSAEEVFKAEVEVANVLNEAEAAQLEEETTPEPEDWRDLIERGDEKSGFRPKNTLKNVILILQGEGGKDVFKRDEFANAELYGRAAPWGGRTGDEVTDLDTIRIKTWLADRYRFEPSDDRINQAISKIGDVNRFHPVRDYVDALVWDGVPRIDTWLKDYLEASAPEPYLSAVSRKVLAALVARVYQPGIKFDYVLIFEGLQGKGKSTALKNLVGDAWFTDSTINVRDKDAVMIMRSKWLIELGELSTMRAADVEELKAFVSRSEDRIRVPYGKRSENFPRQCIFVGTTNRDEYLKDPTGNRRYWPVRVGAIDFKRIARDRDQLLAEAKIAFDLGEPLYLEEEEARVAAEGEQADRSVTDSWEEMITKWLEADGTDQDGSEMPRDRFTMLDLFSDFGPLADWKPNQPELKRAGDALRKLGFSKLVARGPGGRNVKLWVAPGKKKRPGRKMAGKASDG